MQLSEASGKSERPLAESVCWSDTSLCLSIFCSFGVGQILFILLSKTPGTVYKLSIWGEPRPNTTFLLSSLRGHYFIVVRSMDWEELILNFSSAQAQRQVTGTAKITWQEQREVKGREACEGNQLASECFLPFSPKAPQQKAELHLCTYDLGCPKTQT